MSRMRNSKVGFVRKALEQEAAAAVEEPELVATAVIAEPMNAALHPLTSSPSAETNVESEPTESSQQSVPPPATATSITSVEEEPVIGYNTRWGFQPDTHPGIVCKYCRKDGHIKVTCVKKKHVDSRPPKPEPMPTAFQLEYRDFWAQKRSGKKYVYTPGEQLLKERMALQNIEITPVNERRENERNSRSASNFTDEDAARYSNYYQRRNGNSRQACGTRSDSNFDDRYVIRRHFQGDAYVVERDPQRRPDDFDL